MSDPDPFRALEAHHAAGRLTVLLCTRDEAVRAAWQAAQAPPEIDLQVRDARPADAWDTAALVALDLADGLPGPDLAPEAVERTVFIGTAEALADLDPDSQRQAYDLVAADTPPLSLAHRMACWVRSIQKTAALERLGRRVDDLAARNDALAARVAQVETQAEVLDAQRGRLDAALKRLGRAARLAHEINALDYDRLIQTVLARVPDLVEAQRTSLYLYDAATDHLVLQGHTHPRSIAERISLRDNPRSPMAVAVARQELMLIGEFSQFEKAEAVAIDRDYASEYATGSCLIAPLMGGGRVRGVLNLADKADGRPFDAEIDLPAVESLAELIGASLMNIELYREAERRARADPLTGLANRRALEEALDREISRAERYGSDLSVMMFDVDHLKGVNDAHGHEAGDAVLLHLTAVLRDSVRTSDVPGRWAGDEFLVVLPDTKAEPARQMATRLLAGLGDAPPRIGGRPIQATVSIGVAERQRAESAAALVRRVDAAMYDAKKEGRACITVAE